MMCTLVFFFYSLPWLPPNKAFLSKVFSIIMIMTLTFFWFSINRTSKVYPAGPILSPQTIRPHHVTRSYHLLYRHKTRHTIIRSTIYPPAPAFLFPSVRETVWGQQILDCTIESSSYQRKVK